MSIETQIEENIKINIKQKINSSAQHGFLFKKYKTNNL